MGWVQPSTLKQSIFGVLSRTLYLLSKCCLTVTEWGQYPRYAALGPKDLAAHRALSTSAVEPQEHGA